MSEQVLPFYLICDESGSMEDSIEQMNENLLPELHRAIASNPVVADKTRFSIIGFAENARVLLPLSDLSDLEDMPGLVARGTTSFGSAFELLRSEIDADVADLKQQGHLVYRPAVFFLSDGEPTDEEWHDVYSQTMDQSWKYRPNIIAFGIGQYDRDTITSVATMRAFGQEDGASPAKALAEFATALTRSIVRSGSTAGQDGSMKLQIPDTIAGFTDLTLDPL